MASNHSPYSQRLSVVDDPRSPITYLITDCPNEKSLLEDYLPLLQAHDCSNVVRLCDGGAYNADPLRQHGITVWDWPFEDGSVPPEAIISAYRDMLDSLTSSTATSDTDAKRRDSGRSGNASSIVGKSKPAVAIHCISGIGRAPVLVAAALIDCGVDPVEAVELVRAKRRGALNKRQLAWLMDKKGGFKRKKRGKDGKGSIGKMFAGFLGKKD
ncbi:uncharacterized protein SPPG_04109 [Spizellomyces punctatus DAOM BR117]|uniref:Tyrosine specific protein phosphatases domain-containing protein n=1 Tax=Spizellomyces punctatus (strain DAOM BR117) TaxID=645134 RepID=A0A0L0HHS3_SPIPD|nr:uncharacterized protein SPPG_04109 [Spizellomyces punctatus DAOM BR117]KND01016.1 hypothetical protein SPPG_04109 [Spizellomyces punctatus DAOM BR117]|eukprot:XP_016609055.1 hypothetical protein SPPG_04109 [Spizellomyces punctatus DAOM BR117]